MYIHLSTNKLVLIGKAKDIFPLISNLSKKYTTLQDYKYNIKKNHIHN